MSENEKAKWKPAAQVEPNLENLASGMPLSIESIETWLWAFKEISPLRVGSISSAPTEIRNYSTPCQDAVNDHAADALPSPGDRIRGFFG